MLPVGGSVPGGELHAFLLLSNGGTLLREFCTCCVYTCEDSCTIGIHGIRLQPLGLAVAALPSFVFPQKCMPKKQKQAQRPKSPKMKSKHSASTLKEMSLSGSLVGCEMSVLCSEPLLRPRRVQPHGLRGGVYPSDRTEGAARKDPLPPLLHGQGLLEREDCVQAPRREAAHERPGRGTWEGGSASKSTAVSPTRR